jgi:hypothetical protein
MAPKGMEWTEDVDDADIALNEVSELINGIACSQRSF